MRRKIVWIAIVVITILVPFVGSAQMWEGVDNIIQNGEITGHAWICNPHDTPGCLPKKFSNVPLWIDYVEHFCLFDNYEYPGRYGGRHIELEPTELFPEGVDVNVNNFRKICRAATGRYVKSLVTDPTKPE